MYAGKYRFKKKTVGSFQDVEVPKEVVSTATASTVAPEPEIVVWPPDATIEKVMAAAAQARARYAAQMAMPKFSPGMIIETLRDLKLFRTHTLQDPIDLIPQDSVVRILEQCPDKKICAVQFAQKFGYIGIVSRGDNMLCIRSAEIKSMSIDFRNNPGARDLKEQQILDDSVHKYDITEGAVIEALFGARLRSVESEMEAKPPILEDIPPFTMLMVLRIGKGRSVKVRRMDARAPVGWLFSINEQGKPLLGYSLPRYSVCAADVGATMTLASPKAHLDKSEAHSRMSQIVEDLELGTTVTIKQTGNFGGKSPRVKVESQKEDGGLVSGWISLGDDGTKLEPTSHDYTDSIVKQFFEEAKRNCVEDIDRMLIGAKGWCGYKRPQIDDVNVVDGLGRSGLFFAAGFGNMEAVTYFCDHEDIRINARDSFNRNALHYACKLFPGAPVRDQAIYTAIIRKLILSGCAVNHSDEDGWTPLMFAVLLQNVLAVKRLVWLGADPDLKTPKEESAVSIAARLNFTPLHQWLLQDHGDDGPLEGFDQTEEEKRCQMKTRERMFKNQKHAIYSSHFHEVEPPADTTKAARTLASKSLKLTSAARRPLTNLHTKQ
eukprot:GEMP01010002.1.p1 GENE.GEMP01010002.1~~GEMP01010002.1.p1  ORF type:complete len:604 (+),score=96.53 GEMP01010002.1:184-1995(+)